MASSFGGIVALRLACSFCNAHLRTVAPCEPVQAWTKWAEAGLFYGEQPLCRFVPLAPGAVVAAVGLLFLTAGAAKRFACCVCLTEQASPPTPPSSSATACPATSPACGT